MTTFTFGLCAGRHDLPVSDFIFADGDITFPINPTALLDIVATKLNFVNFGDKLDVYVTGLTPVLLLLLNSALLKELNSHSSILTVTLTALLMMLSLINHSKKEKRKIFKNFSFF